MMTKKKPTNRRAFTIDVRGEKSLGDCIARRRRMGLSHLAAVALLALATGSLGQAADTATTVWKGKTDTVWGTSTNWAGSVSPNATISALFDSTFSNQPTLGAAQIAQGISLATGVGQDVTIDSATAQTLTITGTATLNSQASAGIYMNDSGNHSLTIGPNASITLSNNTGFYNQQSAGTLTISGGLDLNAKTLTIGAGTTSTGNVAISGNIASSAGSIAINTAGTVTLSGTDAYSGATTVQRGTLNISGASGAIASSPVTLYSAGTLTIDNTSSKNDRLGGQAFTSYGGTFNFNNPGSAQTESIGTLTLGSGALTMNTGASAGTSAITLSTITRSAGGGTVLFNGTGFGAATNQVKVTTALSSQNVGGILPYALIKDGSTYDLAVGGGASGAITKYASYTTTSGDPAWGATVNARPNGAVTPTAASKSLNSLVLDDTINLSGPGRDVTITLGAAAQAGLVVQTGGNSTISINGSNEYIFAFGTREGIFNIIGTLTFNHGNTSDITGTGGITKTGTGTLVLTGATNVGFAQSVTGALSLNQGTYEIYSAGATNTGFGASTNNIYFNGGNLTYHDNTARTLSNPLTVNADGTITVDRSSGGAGVTQTFGALTVNNNTNLTIAGGALVTNNSTEQMTVGAVTLNSNATFTITNPSGAKTALSVGAITDNGNFITLKGNGNFTQSAAWTAGTGGLTLDSTYSGTATLNQANLFTGTTTIKGGTLALGDNLALQNSALDTSGAGVVSLNAGITTPTIGGLSGSRNIASVITGNYSLVTALTLNPGTSQTNTYSGNITNGAAGMTFTKNGSGTQILAGTNTYTGNTTISAGNLTVSGAGRLANTGNVIITTGGSLLVASSNAIYTSADVTMNGGTLTVAIASMGGNQTFGALTLSSNSTLNFGDALGNTVWFSGGSYASGKILTISGWDLNSDHLYFTTSQAGNLGAFKFGLLDAAQNQITSNQFEIIAVPEPGTILAGALLLGGLAVVERRRLRRMFAGAWRIP